MKRILNYVGSKWNMAKWIIQQMPEHDVYLEPYFGSGAVLFNKPDARIETVNDIDGVQPTFREFCTLSEINFPNTALGVFFRVFVTLWITT